MNTARVVALVLLFAIFNIENIWASNENDKTFFFRNVAITQIMGMNDAKGMEFKILVSAKRKLSAQELLKGMSPTEFVADKPIWEITHRLPVGSDECLEIDAHECDARRNDLYNNACYKPCITYGPEFLTFDEKNNKIYFYAGTTMGGSGGAEFFVFSGDVKTQKIEYLETKFGPFVASMSPDNKYVVYHGMNFIDIYDPVSKETIDISAPYGEDKEKRSIIPDIIDIKWLSDTTFSYHEGTRHSKFQHSHDTMKENVYDIAQKKIIKSRQMNLSEFDHSQSPNEG